MCDPPANVPQVSAARVRRPAQPVARAALTSALIGTLLIALAAFWLSFSALADLAHRAGVPGEQAWVWPLVLDGIIVVSTVSVVALSGHNRAASSYPWLLLLGATAVSVIGNGAHASMTHPAGAPTAIAIGVSAVPPIALVTSTHLSVMLLARAVPPRARARAPLTDEQSLTSAAATLSSRAVSAPRAVARTLTAESLSAWVRSEVDAGRTPTGAGVAAAFGVSSATGRRRLADLRTQGDVASV